MKRKVLFASPSARVLAAGGALVPAQAQGARNDTAEPARQANDALLQEPPFDDTTDFTRAHKGDAGLPAEGERAAG